MNSSTWTITLAKAHFRELIDRAMTEGPQTITRRGRTVAVLVGADEWLQETGRKKVRRTLSPRLRLGNQD
jgi:prevent-host-death family protein